MAQLFGVMPVIGVKSDSVTKLRFKWNSLTTIYSFIVFIGILFNAGLTVRFVLRKDFKFDMIGKFEKQHRFSLLLT